MQSNYIPPHQYLGGGEDERATEKGHQLGTSRALEEIVGYRLSSAGQSMGHRISKRFGLEKGRSVPRGYTILDAQVIPITQHVQRFHIPSFPPIQLFVSSAAARLVAEGASSRLGGRRLDLHLLPVAKDLARIPQTFDLRYPGQDLRSAHFGAGLGVDQKFHDGSQDGVPVWVQDGRRRVGNLLQQGETRRV